MSILPIHALAGLGLLQAAASLPAVMRSADFAGLLRSTLGGASEGPAESGLSTATGSGTVTLPVPGALDAEGLEAQIEALTKTFGARLDQVLSGNGLDTFPGLHLQFNAAGQIRIDGDHPHKEAIEAAIESHPELADIFRAIAANLQLLQAVETPQEKLGGDQASTVDLYVDSAGAEASLVRD